MASGHSNPKKRSAHELEPPEPGPSSKAPKLFPMFAKTAEEKPEKQPDTFRWLPRLGTGRTCLHGVNLEPKPSTKVAAFDLDGCLIQSSHGTKKKTKDSAPSFQWWRGSVPKKLKETLAEGFSIVIITNQALRGSTAIDEWKKKIPLIGAALSDVPFRLFAATAKDGYRKPIPGMWYEIERIFAEEGVQIDKDASLFVGDAAGRKGDFASTDRKWALNVGIPFFTPEEYFLKLNPAPFTLPGFHPSSLPTDVPHITPSSTPIVQPSGKGPELVLFVGYPAMGKTTFFRTHFAPAEYVHVNQDTLKTREKCVKAVETAIQDGKSCVVDNTNRNSDTRKHYVAVAKEHGVPIQCFLFEGSLELAWHNNLYRAYNMPADASPTAPKRDLVPYSGFSIFKNNYEEPQLSEGFSAIKRVNWVFEGTDLERARWNMWLQIDGK